MAIEIVPFTREHEAAAQRFNRRMREGKAPSAFDLPERVGTPKEGTVRAQHYVALDGGEIRGGIIILEHPAYLNDSSSEGGSARRQLVINLQSPLSEAIVDSKYAMVSIQLIRFALKRCPFAYVVGMGSEENPLPRLLKAAGWTVRPVPFFFRILRASRALTQLKPLQRKAPMRAGAMIGAYTGTGALALAFVQRARASAAGLRAELAPRGGDAQSALDNAIWGDVEKRISFGVVRDSSTIPSFLLPQVERYRVYRGAECLGWFSLLVSQMRDHNYFGDMKVATLIDVIARDPSDLASMMVLATRQARGAGCDLIVSNQLQSEAQNALRGAGFLSFGSNYLMASSKQLSAAMKDATSLVSRQDGDGLVNLRGASA